MKHKLLSLMALAFVALGVNAQSWTEPTDDAEPATVASDPVSGHVYKIKNVDAEAFLGGGKVWFDWNTTACLIDEAEAISFTATNVLDDEGSSKGWTFYGYDGNWPNNYVFVSGNGIEGFAMHVDNPTDVHRYFELLKQDNGTYRIRVAAADDTYGQATVEDWENKFWGWDSADEEHPTNIVASASPSETVKVEFEFYDQNKHLYQLRQQLYALALTIEEEGLDVNYEAYTSVYEGTDEAAMKETIAKLEKEIFDARIRALFTLGEDGLNPPSPENPADVTAIINNPEFYDCSNGNFPGWTIYAPNGGNTWKNGNDYVEYWNGTASKGVFDYYQELPGLPAGLYSLTASMWNSMNGVGGDFEPTSGVYGTTSMGTTAALVTIDSDNGNLNEYTTDKMVLMEGDTLRIGVKNLKTMVARWFGVDYIHMTYYGPVDDPLKALLDATIEKCESEYEYIDEVFAEATVKEAYEAALAEAKEATDNYEEYTAKLQEALEALEASERLYAKLNTLIEQWEEKMASVEGTKWATANEEIAEKLEEMQGAYDDGSYSAEDIAKAEQELSSVFAEAIGAAVKKGDDLTFLLVNPDFVTNFSGWTVDEEGATPAHGGVDILIPGDHPRYDELAQFLNEEGKLNNGNAEVYRAVFDINQTIVNMPAGIFTLSCQAFERDDNGAGTEAELYAIMPDGTEQTVKVKDLHSETSPDELYNGSFGGDQHQLTDSSYGDGYVPNGMEGANIYFKLGYYKNYFDINLPERGNLTVGIRTASSGDWVLFDDFKIVYKGDDASAYQETIDRLVSQAQQFLLDEEGYLTQEAFDAVDKAINEGNSMLANLDNASKEEAMEVIDLLNEAIALATESNRLYSLASHEVAITEDYRISYREHEVVSSDTALGTLLNELNSKLSETQAFATNAELEAVIPTLRKAFTIYVQHDQLNATEDQAADVTAAIYNFGCEDYDGSASITGWTSTVAPGLAEGVAEVFNNNFTLSQVIYGLAPGFYRLGVQGFNRFGGYANVEKALNTDSLTEQKLVTLFADEASTYLLPISTDMEKYTNEVIDAEADEPDGAKITLGEEVFYVPNSMAQAANAFAGELYQNVLQFEVKEGQESVTIGLKKTEHVTDDWTIWDNWTLYYLGTTAPSTDPTTDIHSLQNNTVAGTVIYNLAGQRVSKATKGIYIINGKKVLF